MRTSSEAARDSAAICSTVPAMSAVSVLVIDCTTIGAPPPTATLPTMTCVVLCRPRGPATSVCSGFSSLFMGSRISGFGDIQQWINHRRARAVNEIEPGDNQNGGDGEGRCQGVMHDEITTDHAKQRGDEAKSRQFAGGIDFYQRKPQHKRHPNHPDRLIGHQRQ